MASDTIEQMAEKIRTFAEDIIRENFAPVVDATPAPFHAGQTVDAATAWEAMGFGWCVDDGGQDGTVPYWIDGEGSCRVGFGAIPGVIDRGLFSVDCEEGFTLTRIHPDAHQHAMQRLLADGLAVGSRVEVVRGWKRGDGGFDIPQSEAPINCVGRVTGFDNIGVRCECDDTFAIYPAHVLRLLPAESEQQDGEPGYEGDPNDEKLPADFPKKWVPAYTPPCDAPEGFEWAGREDHASVGEWYWEMGRATQFKGVRYPQSLATYHILRKLPATTGEQQDGVDIDDVMLEDIAPLPLPDNRPAEWKNKQHFHSFNGGVVTAGVDTDGDMGLIDKSGYSIGIRCGDVPAFAAWLSRNFPAPNPEDQVPPATTTGEGAGLRVGEYDPAVAYRDGDVIWVRGVVRDCRLDDCEYIVRVGPDIHGLSKECCVVREATRPSSLRPVAASEIAGGGE